MFSIGILPSSLLSVHLNYFYSQKKIIQANISYFNMLTAFLVFAPLLFKTIGYAGLALASSLASTSALLTLFFYTPQFIEKKEYMEFVIFALIFSIFINFKMFVNYLIEFFFDSFLSLIFFLYFRRKWKITEI